jgi:N-acetylglucosaminyldiphosphoundecaprenol N-acetyl-beta-D-mannosaminyltransferase
MNSESKISVTELNLLDESEESLVKKIIASCLVKKGGRVLTVNLDIFRQLYLFPELRECVAESTYKVADGWPIILFSWLEKTVLLPRITGSNLVLSLAKSASNHDLKMFLVGGAPLAAEKSREFLYKLSGRKLKIEINPLPSGFERSHLNALKEQVRDFAPDLVFVAVGFPKAEDLIDEIQPVAPNAWFVGVGISFSYMAGLVIKAPRWAQTIGVEWLFRLCQEPRRLFRRYVLQDLPFLVSYLFSDSLVQRFLRK